MTTSEHSAEDRRQQSLIGAIISVLDDRNLDAALRLLEPARKARDAAPQEQAPRCTRCVTRGE